jgi:hypothetical protein
MQGGTRTFEEDQAFFDVVRIGTILPPSPPLADVCKLLHALIRDPDRAYCRFKQFAILKGLFLKRSDGLILDEMRHSIVKACIHRFKGTGS